MSVDQGLRRRRTSRSGVTGLLLSLTVAVAVATAAPIDETVKELRSQGVPGKEADRLARALVQVDKQGSSKPLWPLFQDESLVVTLLSGVVAISLDEEGATKRVIAAVKKDRGSIQGLLLALGFSYRRETVEFLVKELVAARNPERAEAALFSLRVLTGQPYKQPAEWQAWWQKHGAKLVLTPPVDQEEQERRVRGATALVTADKLRSALAPMTKLKSEKAAKATEAVGKVLQGFFDLVESGARMQISEAAREGDRALSAGLLADAAGCYEEAVASDARDLRSAFLRGCILFELNRRDEAALVFRGIVEAEPRAVGSQLLLRLCTRPVGPSLLAAAREELAAMELPSADELGWGDPVLTSLVAQQLAGGGPAAVRQELLDELLLRFPDDAELHCGVAQCRRKEAILPAFETARARFPQSALAVAGWLGSTQKSIAKIELPAKLEAARKWCENDPENGFPRLYLAALENPRDRKGEKSQPLPAESLATIVAAVSFPKFDDTSRAFSRELWRSLALIDHPLPMMHNSTVSLLSGEIVDLFRRWVDSEQALFDAGQPAEGERIAAALALFAERMRKSNARGVAGTLVNSFAITVLDGRKKRLMNSAEGSAESIAALESQIGEIKEETKRSTNLRSIYLQMIPVPKLQKEFVDEWRVDSVGSAL